MKTAIIITLFVISIFRPQLALSQGNTCANAIPVSAMPFTYSGTTCGFGDDYSSSNACGSSYMNGDDILFVYTPAASENVNVSLTTDATWVGVIISLGCPAGGTCVGAATNSGANASGGPYALTAGNTYYFTVSTYPSPQCINNFTLNLNANAGGNCAGGPPCNPSSPLANDICSSATPICEFEGYCGNTSATYTAGNIPSGFCGSVENNSWLSFTASAATATFNAYVCNCEDGYGIQMEIYSTTDCVNFISFSNCWNPGDEVNGTVTATGLVPGQTYYMMIDGNAGDVCNYTISATSGVWVSNAVITENNTNTISICAGQSVHFSATGGTAYSWSPATGLDNPNNANPIASPTTTTTYTCTITGGNVLCPGSQTVSLVVNVSSQMTANPGACVPANSNYALAGTITFPGMPTTGTLTITDVESGVTQTFSPPFVSPYNYTLNGITADGLPHTVTASFSAASVCTLSATYTAPNACSTCNAAAGPNQTLCGGSATLAAVEVASDINTHWLPLAGVTFSDINSPTSTMTAAPGSYDLTWEITNSSGLTCSDQVTIVLNAIPTSTFTTNTPVCVGTDIVATYTGTGGAQFDWNFTGGTPVDATTQGPHNITYTAGSYTLDLTVISAESCTSAVSTNSVVVNSIPLSSFTAVSPICIGTSSTINYTGGCTTCTYSWNFDGGTVQSGSNGGPYQIQWATPGTYDIVLSTTNNGCTSTATTNSVIVYGSGDPFCCQMPTPFAGNDDAICGLTYTLVATPSLPAGTWSCVQAGVTINSPNNPISVVTVPANGTYDFVWYEIFGVDCDSTDTVSITFTQQPIANAGNNFDICSHTNTLSATPSVGVGTWTCTNPLVTFTPATSPTATVTVPADGQYVFTWTENNTNGCISSDFITANFAEQPIANAGADNAVCLLDYTLQATPSVGTGTWTSTGPGSAMFQNSHSPITQVIVSLSGSYTFTWTEDNGLGCTATDDVVIQLTQIPTSTFTTTEIACFGNSTTVNYTGVGNSQCTFTWDFNGGTATPGTGMGPHSVTWAAANTYNISLQVSLNGCMSTTTTNQVVMPEPLIATISGVDLPCFGIPTGQVLLDVSGGTPSSSGGYYYIWNNGYLSEDLTNMSEGYYAVTITDDNGCSLTRNRSIVQPPQLSLVITPSQTICPGTSAPLTIYPVGGTYPYTYFWNGAQSGVTITVNPSANTTYTAYVTDALGCQSQIVSTTVSIYPELHITAFANIDSICPSEYILITYTVSDGSGAPYTVIGSDGVHLSNPYLYYPAASGSYIVTATDDCGQIATDEIPIHVYPLPPNAFLADTVRGCQPFTVNFIEISPDNGQTYIWDFGDYTNLSLDKTPTHTYTIPGTFDITLTVTSTDNCKTVNVVDDFITVYPRPNALFTYNPSVVSILKPIVSFTNLSDWGATYMWSFGTGDSTSEMNPVYRFPDVGEYPVSLIAISENGCKDTSAVSIKVNDEVTFYAPSAFSPDNDQTNDLFFVTGHGIDPTKFKMIIYDRWGQELFVTDKFDPNNPEIYGWNGKDKSGKTVKSGTYTWLVVFNDFRYSRHEYAGTVTVVW